MKSRWKGFNPQNEGTGIDNRMLSGKAGCHYRSGSVPYKQIFPLESQKSGDAIVVGGTSFRKDQATCAEACVQVPGLTLNKGFCRQARPISGDFTNKFYPAGW